MSTYPTPLVPQTIDAAMQLLTINMLGLPAPQEEDDPVYQLVRIGWQAQGQPFQTSDKDVAYVRAIEVDDQYNRVRDVQMIPNPNDQNVPPQSLLQVTTYQRVWENYWEFYGPNSFDHARIVRSALFTQVVHDTFAALNLNLYWVTDPAAPDYFPYFQDGQWWYAVSFKSRFNEGVTETLVIPLAASVETIVNVNNIGQTNDFTTELQ